jgi:N-methylhydantoinase B
MRGKGKQFVPEGRRVVLALPGGAGYGPASARDKSLVRRDLARGYISEKSAMRDYGLTAAEVAEISGAVRRGETK